MDKFYHVLKFNNRVWFVRTTKTNKLTIELSQVIILTFDGSIHHFMFTTPDDTSSQFETMAFRFVVDVLKQEVCEVEYRGNWILRTNERAHIERAKAQFKLDDRNN